VTLPRFPSNDEKSLMYETEIGHIDDVITGDSRRQCLHNQSNLGKQPINIVICPLKARRDGCC
jgi:hypothetical protein